MSDTVKFTITEGRREAIDNLIRKTVKAKFAEVVAIEAPLDRRYSNREATENDYGWAGYERYLLANGHTVYVGLSNPSEPSVSISEKVDPRAQKKVASLAKKKVERAERKAAREAKKTARAAKPKAIRQPKELDKKLAKASKKALKVFDKLAVEIPAGKGKRSRLSIGEADEVSRIQREQKVTYKSAQRILRQRQAIADADKAAATPVAKVS